MTEPEITVKKLSWPVSIQLLGTDEQGRQLYRCPSRGCGETAYFDEDGKGHCPVGRSEERRVGKECRSRWSPYH